MEEVVPLRPIKKTTQKKEQTPSWYLIFDDGDNTDGGNMKLLDEIAIFENKTKLPCHVIRQKVLIHSPKVIFHADTTDEKKGVNDGNTARNRGSYTEPNTVKKLWEKGLHNFISKEEIVNEDIHHDDFFKKIAKDTMGEDVLPVIIALQNGEMTTNEQIITTSTTYQVPIIFFKKDTLDVSVLWSTEKDNKSAMIFTTNYENFIKKTETIHPWQKKQASKESDELSNTIAYISEIQGTDIDMIDTLICNLIVSVCLKEALLTKEHHMNYLTALLKYLFKKGDWTIYNQYMTMCFKKRHLEYIHEEVMSKRKLLSKIGDQPNDSEANDEEIIKKDYELNGLLFAALVYNSYLDAALKMVQEGQIGIHHLLVGCVLLQNEINSRKTTTAVKEKLQRFEKTFTEKAINITSYIYDADKEHRNADKENKNADEENKNADKENKNADKENKNADKKNKNADKENKNADKENKNADRNKKNDSGNNVSHAGRLLLNHGYLRDAISTKNISYLESATVKRILKKMFYDTECVQWQTTLCIILLLGAHMFVLPLLMINVDARPFNWFYQKYRLHFMKVYIHMLGFSVLLFAYAYMLLFDYRTDGITHTDYLIIAWMASFFVDEMKQVFVALIRGKFTRYSNDWWNLLDWLMIILYASGMLLKIGEGSGFKITSKLLLIVVFTALCTRLLHLSCMTEFLGRKLVINRKMIKDTIAFMIIITIVMLWYSVSFYSLLYPNSEFSWIQIEKILRNGYWMLFGELDLDVPEPECTFNRTLYESSSLQSCPTKIGLYVTPYLKAVYGLIAVVLLLNLLIAIYSDTYTRVQQNATLSWLRIQIDLFEEYSIKTVFPIHLQLLALLGLIFRCCFSAIKRIFVKEDDKKQQAYPMFVKVFLYDASYDEKLVSTYLAEEKAVPKATEYIDFSDSDAIKTLKELDKIKYDLEKMNTKTVTEQKRIGDDLEYIKTMFTKRQNNMEEKLNKLLRKFELDEGIEETAF